MECRKLGLRIWLPLLCTVCVLFLAACGGGGDSASGEDSGAAVVPTMPSARFTAVAQQNPTRAAPAAPPVADNEEGGEAESETTTTITATDAVTDAVAPSPGLDEALLERGAGIYERNNCASCHGAAGEGVAGQAGAIAGTTLSESDFADILRTGGGLGNSHIFGTSAVSRSGMGALYAYVQSLGD